MARPYLALPLVLLLCVPAFAAPDAYAAWKKAHRKLSKAQEKPYWDGFARRLDSVWGEWQSESELWRGDREFYRAHVHSLEDLRALYGDYVDLQRERLEADRQLAASGHPKALETLFDALLDVIKDCERLDLEIADGRPIAYFSLMYDQKPAVKRHGLAVRVDGLVETLGGMEDAVGWLAEAGWAEAQKGDKKKSLARRAAVLDALGVGKDAAARPRLEEVLSAPQPGLRIVALENLVGFGVETSDVLKPLLSDPAPAVRRALLETIAARGADEPLWIPFALEAYKGQSGLVRARALEALGALTGEALPDETAPWEAWFAEHLQDIKNRVWKRPEPEKKADEPKAPDDGGKKKEEAPAEPDAPKVAAKPLSSFYGVGAPSYFMIFAFDGSTDMDMPADLQTQTSKSKTHWQSTVSKWRKEMLDHRTLLRRELDTAIAVMPEAARFATIHLWGTNLSKIPVMGARKPLEPKKSTRKKVAKTIEKARPQGQFSVEEATRLALQLCGQDPFENPDPDDVLLDAMFLLAPGWIGGRWTIPEAMVADFERRNRFHRLQVNTIRITDRKEDSVLLMKGLAEVSGGTYLWLEEVP